MKQFLIFHPTDKTINDDMRIDIQFTVVAGINVPEGENVFKYAQNDFNPDYAKAGVRSTCVGDIFVDFEAPSAANMFTGAGIYLLEFSELRIVTPLEQAKAFSTSMLEPVHQRCVECSNTTLLPLPAPYEHIGECVACGHPNDIITSKEEE